MKPSAEKQTPVDLSILVLNYNSGDHLLSSLSAALVSASGLECELFAIDNASSDDSFQKAMNVIGTFQSIHWIPNSRNVGFARGINPSLRRARGRWIALINPDTRVQNSALADLVRFGDSLNSAGILGGKLLYPDGQFQWACRRKIPTPKTALARLLGRKAHYNYSEDMNQSMEVEAVSGSFMLIRQSILKKVGYFDEAFFMYGEDLDFCLRCRAAGWKIRYQPQAVAVHAKGESSRQGNYRALYEFYRAMYIFHRKHVAPQQSWPANALIQAGIFLLGAWNLALYPVRRDKRVGSRT